MKFLIGLKNFVVKSKKMVDQISEGLDYAKSVKEGKGTKKIGGNILKHQVSKRLKKMFK
jgi:hypothetical protein